MGAGMSSSAALASTYAFALNDIAKEQGVTGSRVMGGGFWWKYNKSD